MNPVNETQFPEGSLIAAEASRDGFYTDSFSVDVPVKVDLSDFIQAFYTTTLFRLERIVLSITAKGRMRDADVVALSQGRAQRMSVWRVEARRGDEILLNAGRTKSWLMVVPKAEATQLFFGSVVVPEPPKRPGAEPRLGPVFDSLIGAHTVYSRLLLGSAARRLS